MQPAWDSLLEQLEQLASDPARPITADVEQNFSTLAEQAMAEGTIDRELHVPDIARWLCGLAVAHREVHRQHARAGQDDDLGPLLVIATRWLHPARPR
ncbi:hypothetical protein [Aeromicrobium sp. P5_D10]